MTQVPDLPRSALESAGAIVTDTSLALSNLDLPWEDFERLGEFIGRMNQACAWWVGDLVLFGEQVYGEEHAQIDVALRLSPQTIANRASVARHIPPSRRRASLAFGTHAEVAYLEPKERDRWLDRAEKGRWTRAILREHLREARGIQSDPVGNPAVTSSADDGEQRLQGDLVPGPMLNVTCPNCGHQF